MIYEMIVSSVIPTNHFLNGAKALLTDGFTVLFIFLAFI